METTMDPNAIVTERVAPLPLAGRIPFLDGMRGLTALYVVMYHCYFTEVTAFDISKNFTLAQRLRIHWLGFGEEAMAVFLVISGYCLMRPVLANGARIPGGIGCFLRRRATRLLIPYYVMLLLMLLMITFVPAMNRINVDLFKTSNPQENNFAPGVLASHFLLFDNLKYSWKFSIDPPAWSVATMWWMYILFAVVLLPLWRRLGSVATAALLLVVTLVPHFLLKGKGDVASPWFIGIFAIGMAAAAQTVRSDKRRDFPQSLWLLTGAFLFAVCAYIGLMHEQLMWNYVFAIDILVGCAAACFIVYSAERLKSKSGLPFPLDILETRPLAALGRMSYSLYLVHFPTLWMIHAHVTSKMEAPVLTKLAVLMGAGIPASLLLAYFFHVAIERRFRRSETGQLQSAVPVCN